LPWEDTNVTTCLVTGGAGFLDDAEAVQTRHPRVGDDQLKIGGILGDSGDGCAPVRGDLDVMPGGFQRPGQHIEHKSVIVRAKDTEGLRLDHLSSVSLPSATMPSTASAAFARVLVISAFDIRGAASVMPAGGCVRQ
jgi:hypothetical protein